MLAVLQGTWMCSLRGDCSWSIINSGGVSLISMLRLLRFFRIAWILKHVKFMHFSTILGSFAVSWLHKYNGGIWQSC
jgi:hypothetical protein